MDKLDIILLTPINLEFDFIKNYLKNGEYAEKKGTPYFVGTYQGEFYKYSVGLCLTGSKISKAALATERAISAWSPDLIILTGIAGGVKDVDIGDIVVATQAYGYESGKITEQGMQARPYAYPYNQDIISRLTVFKDTNWKNNPISKEAKVCFAPIASGDKVIANKDSDLFRYIKSHYNDTAAVEMEAIGFAQAMQTYPFIRHANIRGISDLIDGKSKSDKEGGQEIAMKNVSAFLFAFLHQLDFQSLTIYAMNPKDIAKKVVGTIFPFLNFKSIKKAGEELKEATDNSIGDLWKKVRPWLIEDIEDLDESDLGNEEEMKDLESDMVSTLRKAIKKEEVMGNELLDLIKKVPQGNVHISNSKNVIQGSNISVGGDFRLGDDNITNSSDMNINNHGEVGKQVNIKENKGDLNF